MDVPTAPDTVTAPGAVPASSAATGAWHTTAVEDTHEEVAQCSLARDTVGVDAEDAKPRPETVTIPSPVKAMLPLTGPLTTGATTIGGG